MMTRMPPNNVEVVIVESHQHALEHIHRIIRRRKLFTQSWSMLHFDAHPDLACAGNHVPAMACFLPRHSSSWIEGVEVNDGLATAAGTSVHKNGCCASAETTTTTTRATLSSSTKTTTIVKTVNNDDKLNGENDDENHDTKENITISTRAPLEDLYELLDTTASGISEWILPLVLAGNLERIEWVKPPFSTQLPCGRHRFHVGAYYEKVVQEKTNQAQAFHTSTDANHPRELDERTIQSFLDLSPFARIKVDWEHPYYLDDDSFVPTELLALKQPLELSVVELPRREHGNDETVGMTAALPTEKGAQYSQPWSLDICLDYFTCVNPFLQDIELLDPLAFNALNMVISQGHAFITRQDVLVPKRTYRKELLRFRQILTDLLKNCRTGTAPSKSTSLKVDVFSELLLYYKNSTVEETKAMLYEVYHAVANSKHCDEIVSLAIEALPYWSMPHAQSSMDPNNIEAALVQVEAELVQYSKPKDNGTISQSSTNPSYKTLPFVITICRSTDDGFTHKDTVEDLQQRVLDMLHRVYCDLNSHCHRSNTTATTEACCCRLQVVRDYGPWEGSTSAQTM
jgi:hypothetical protein